jgi:uncharacterized protein YciI
MRALAGTVAAVVLLMAMTTTAEAAPVKLFVITYTVGPAWKPGVAMKDQGLGPHAAYMKALRDTGRSFAAGPFAGTDGGMVIVKAADADAAKDIVAHDPAVTGGIFTGTVQGWTAVFDCGKSLADFAAAP